MPSDKPHISFFPALPLAKNIELGEWLVGTPPADTPWAPGRFRELSEVLIHSFEKRGFKDGALMWHRDRGFDGSLPTDEEIQTIRAAVAFAVLDANDQVPELNKCNFMATTDNADLFMQPIDEDGGITHSREGALKRIIVGGMKIGDDPPPLADTVEKIARPVRASAKLAGAIYSAVRSGTGDGPSITIAADWHRGALVNSGAMTPQHRLVSLKVGFEALFHEDDSRECARLLRALFETTTAGHQKLLPWIGLLWSPTEKTGLQRQHTKPSGKIKIDVRSEIEDWFMAFAQARNDIIHKGTLTTGLYRAPPERPLSRYAGTLFWKAERVLREAVKAKLGVDVLLCGLVARQNWIPDAIQAAEAAPAAPESPPAPPDPAELARRAKEAALYEKIKREPRPPDRDLAALLAALGCGAANEVRLSKAHGFPSASEEAAFESSIRMMDKWHADVGDVDRGQGRGVLISATEGETLRAAGAEEELADHWWSCP